MYKKALSTLREEIKALAAEGRALNPEIQAASGRARASLRVQKAEVGDRARHLLIAYAFLRGVPYAALERVCSSAPSAQLVARHAERLLHGSSEGLADWLAGREPAAAQAAAE